MGIMKEMLGNQFFLARKYEKVVEIFEPFWLSGKANENMKKKLIIAYCQMGRVEQALDLFIHVIKSNIRLITETDPILEDCPCPELVYDLEKKMEWNDNSVDYYITLAILWAYCDIEKTRDYFSRVLSHDPEYTKIKIALTIIQNFLDKKHKAFNK